MTAIRFASSRSSDNLWLSSNDDASRRHRLLTLAAFIVLQCVLYGVNLKLLPMWGDETFTVVTVAETPAQIIQIVRQDIHPPLYFLLAHWWNRLPIGSDPLVRLRALSALFAILTTVFIDRRWLRDAPRSLRNWFLVLWTFSPCLLLYSRMARSYSMQVFLASMAIWYLLRFAEDATRRKTLAAFVAALAALLYTHYLPGIAVWAGANLLLAMRLRRGRSLWKTWLLPNLLVVVLYVPWLVVLSGALGQWRQGRGYYLTGNVWAEQVLKLAYWFYSFTFGEAIPLWLLPVTIVLAVPCLWLFVSGVRLRRDRFWPALFAATVAFLGATRWVSYPAMPARLFFLLPLFLVALAAGITAKHRTGTALGVVLFTANLVGLWTYYGARDFLNAGYLVSNQTVASEISSHSSSENTVVWIDALNFDGTTLEYYLPKSFRVRWLDSPESIAAAGAEVNAGPIRHIWFVRSSHDISPGHVFEQLESQMTRTSTQHTVHNFVPFSPVQLEILRMLEVLRHQDGSRTRQYMYQMDEFHDPGM